MYISENQQHKRAPQRVAIIAENQRRNGYRHGYLGVINNAEALRALINMARVASKASNKHQQQQRINQIAASRCKLRKSM